MFRLVLDSQNTVHINEERNHLRACSKVFIFVCEGFYMYAYMYMHIHIYKYISVCDVCVCVCMEYSALLMLCFIDT